MLIKGRLASARAYLEIHHVMTIQEYADAQHLSYTAAQRELKAAAQDPASGIAAVGSGSHRIYKLRVESEEES